MTAHPYADTLKTAQEVVRQLGSQLEPNNGHDGQYVLDRVQLDGLIDAVTALGRMIREQYLRDYAETILLEHTHVEFMSVFEMAEEHLVGGGELTEEEAHFVHGLLGDATVTVRMPLLPEGVDE